MAKDVADQHQTFSFADLFSLSMPHTFVSPIFSLSLLSLQSKLTDYTLLENDKWGIDFDQKKRLGFSLIVQTYKYTNLNPYANFDYHNFNL